MSTSRPLTLRIHTSGLSSTRLATVNSGSNGIRSSPFEIARYFACIVTDETPKSWAICSAVRCGSCDGSVSKLTRTAA
jgi:hypothetical protein